MLGIDFGTSTTEVAVYRDGRVTIVPGPGGHEVVPSVVAFLPSGKVCVGHQAVERRSIDPKNTIHSVKRIMGLGWFDRAVVDYRDTYAFDLEKSERGQPQFVTRLGKLTPVEVATMQLESVRNYHGLSAKLCKNVIVTVPPSFDAKQKMAMVTAAQKAGFESVGLIDEPYAAALPYLKRTEESERIVVVYDLGGGTFDVAVLRFRGIMHRVLGFGGDAHLGGDDLDKALAQGVADTILKTHRWDVRSSKEVFHKLIGACEGAKIRLSQHETTTLGLDAVDPVLSGKSVTIDRKTLEAAIYRLIQSTFVICDQVLGEAGLKPSGVDQVILAGGSTYLPTVRNAVRDYFGVEPTSNLPSDRIVAMGASISAALQAGDASVLAVG